MPCLVILRTGCLRRKWIEQNTRRSEGIQKNMFRWICVYEKQDRKRIRVKLRKYETSDFTQRIAVWKFITINSIMFRCYNKCCFYSLRYARPDSLWTKPKNKSCEFFLVTHKHPYICTRDWFNSTCGWWLSHIIDFFD